MFEILVDCDFKDICTDVELQPINRKKVLSLINDYEDGKWRSADFQSFIWDNIKETALSEKERLALVNQEHTTLTAVAKKLRLTDKETDISKGSELAEILLYGIMSKYYNALPVVPKIFYKQNPQDNAKGADSVHIVINDNEEDFSLWFGEAKFYNSIEDARLAKIISSIENSLGTEKIKKENSIITSLADLDLLVSNTALKEKILLLLNGQSSLDIIKPKLHIPILLLHECKLTQDVKSLTDEYKDNLINYHKDRANSFFQKQIAKLKDEIYLYEKIYFHIILFPVPDKKSIVDKFVKTAEFLKDN